MCSFIFFLEGGKMDNQQLIKKYNDLLRRQKNAEANLIEMRAKYKYEKTELDKLLESLNKEFGVSTIDDAKNLLEQLKVELEMDLTSIEDSLSDIRDI